jgi:hypothetical protein
MTEEDNLVTVLNEIERILPQITTIRDAAKLLALATKVAQETAVRYLTVEARLGELIRSEQETRKNYEGTTGRHA